MIDEALAAAFGVPEITIVSDYSITPELAEQCYDLGNKLCLSGIAVDKQVYRNKLYAAPDFCIVFINKKTNKVVGYFIILPLTNDAILRYMDGKLSHDSIKPSDLQDIEDDQIFNLFFDSLVLHPDYQTSKMAKLFFALLGNMLVERARRFSYCNYILIEQHKAFEKTICEKLNAKLLKMVKCPSGRVGNLYGAKFDHKIFQRLPNYAVLDFAYSNKNAERMLSYTTDLWAQYQDTKKG